MEEIINVAFCCDDKFADKMVVTMLSVAENTKNKVAFYVVNCGISNKNKDLANSLKLRYENIADIVFKEPVKSEVLENFKNVSQWPISVFYSLTIPMLFQKLTRIIYLDCDVIVCCDISELWAVDLHNKPIGIVEDEGTFNDAKFFIELKRKHEIFLPKDRKYFYSGLLVIDAQKFFEHKIFERIIEFVSKRIKPLPCPEQDAMNSILTCDEIQALNPRFNFTPFTGLAKKIFKIINEKPAIVHYTLHKPWEFNVLTVNIVHMLFIDRYFTKFIKLYWKYSDKINKNGFSSKKFSGTLKYFYKKILYPIEYFIRRQIRDNIIKIFTKK